LRVVVVEPDKPLVGLAARVAVVAAQVGKLLLELPELLPRRTLAAAAVATMLAWEVRAQAAQASSSSAIQFSDP
jgi:hypothetical protein